MTGTLLGVLATIGHAGHQHRPVVIPPGALVSDLGGAVPIGMIAGVHPSIRAARLTPTEALSTT
ncbi:hypothetical protein Psi02_16850 [Planotetraspora silvatica]|uniref:Uncharacterized protein n=1 Tax=Planotetraspora silvatica TaxID=234614 RepID=A0A8J3XMI3_9ACTN|nr:hypothetical protein [Planotetraspora silvatica]GII45261.1 hypothetical protein Psi02_16850 [Planotetraspora silvatica]